jgi:hypothetical protein
MNSVEYRGVTPIPNAAVEVIKTGLTQLVENRASIYDSNGGSLIDQTAFVADATGAFRFWCDDRVDIYYNNVLSWTDVLVSEAGGDSVLIEGVDTDLTYDSVIEDFDLGRTSILVNDENWPSQNIVVETEKGGDEEVVQYFLDKDNGFDKYRNWLLESNTPAWKMDITQYASQDEWLLDWDYGVLSDWAVNLSGDPEWVTMCYSGEVVDGVFVGTSGGGLYKLVQFVWDGDFEFEAKLVNLDFNNGGTITDTADAVGIKIDGFNTACGAMWHPIYGDIWAMYWANATYDSLDPFFGLFAYIPRTQDSGIVKFKRTSGIFSGEVSEDDGQSWQSIPYVHAEVPLNTAVQSSITYSGTNVVVGFEYFQLNTGRLIDGGGNLGPEGVTIPEGWGEWASGKDDINSGTIVAGLASSLETSRNIELSGVLSGTESFDGSSDISIPANFNDAYITKTVVPRQIFDFNIPYNVDIPMVSVFKEEPQVDITNNYWGVVGVDDYVFSDDLNIVNDSAVLGKTLDEDVAPSLFYANGTRYTKMATLSGGDVFIAYADTSSSYNGVFGIFDEDGVEQKASTLFGDPAGEVYVSDVHALSNGGAVILYREKISFTYYIKFAIYDSSGTYVGGQAIDSHGTTNVLSSYTALELSTGNILMIHKSIPTVYYSVYSNTGVEVTAPTTLNLDNIEYVYTTLLSNNNILMAYSSASSPYAGTFKIYDNTMSEVVGATVFEGEGTSATTTLTLSNGNTAIGYAAGPSQGDGYFVIYDNTGTEVLSKTLFYDSTDRTYDISLMETLDNDLFITFRRSANATAGLYAHYDFSGNLLNEGQFSSVASATDYQSDLLSNGKVFTVYRDYQNSFYGTFIIYYPSQYIDNIFVPLKTKYYIDATYWTNIDTFTIDETLNSQQISYALSFDDMDSWFVQNSYYPRNIVKNDSNIWKYNDAVPTLNTIPETIFNAVDSHDISTTTLTNGNVLIAYREPSGGFVIYDSTGTEVVGETIFNAGTTSNISTTKLTNGNVLIAYTDVSNSNYGTLVIYNSSGTEVVGETIFNAGTTYYISSTELSNGNMLIAYTDVSNSSYGTFVIYDNTGVEVVGETVFNTGATYDISPTTLTNGNMLIAYRDGGNSNYGTFVIYDSTGTEVVGETIFNAEYTYYISSTELSNGNMLIAYRDGGNSNYGTFVIYDNTGVEVVGATVFNAGTTYYISSTELSNGNILIAYTDVSNSSYGTFVIYDNTGVEVVGATVFNAGNTEFNPTTLLTNGNVLIAYRNLANFGRGTLLSVSPDGTEVGGKILSENWVSASENTEFKALEEAMTIELNKMDSTVLGELDTEILGDTIALSASLYTDDGAVSPEFNGISFQYDANTKNVQAIVGTDYECDHPEPDVVRIQALIDGNFKVRAL